MCTTSFKLRCIHEIEATLSTPEAGYSIINPGSVRFCYIKQNRLKYINLPTKTDAVIFFKMVGVIDSYSIENNDVQMFKEVLFTVTGDKGQPIQYSRSIPLRWDDLSFSPCQVITFAAQYEWELTGRTMGKVISIGKSILKAA